MRDRRQPEIIAGRVNADGSIAAGDGFTVQKAGTGSYTITFASGFRLVGMTSTPISAGNTHFAHPSGFTERSISVTLFTSAGAALDFAFSFTAVGVQQ